MVIHKVSDFKVGTHIHPRYPTHTRQQAYMLIIIRCSNFLALPTQLFCDSKAVPEQESDYDKLQDDDLFVLPFRASMLTKEERNCAIQYIEGGAETLDALEKVETTAVGIRYAESRMCLARLDEAHFHPDKLRLYY